MKNGSSRSLKAPKFTFISPELIYLEWMKEVQSCTVPLSLESCQVGFGPALHFICRILRNEVSVLSVGG